MTKLRAASIDRVWTHPSEPNRIHYIINATGDEPRHLYTARNSALGRVLALTLPKEEVTS